MSTGGREAPERRKARGWTQKQLSARLRELGYPLPPEQISRIEKGRRGVSLNDAYAIAYACDCSLLYLLVDPDAKTPVDPELPKVNIADNVQPEEQGDVREWVLGQNPLLFQDGTEYARQRSRLEIEAMMEAVRAVRLGGIGVDVYNKGRRSGQLAPL